MKTSTTTTITTTYIMASSHTHRSDEANSRWDYLSSDVKNKLSFMDPNGMFIVCMCCQLFGRVSDKSTKNLEKECGSIKLRRPFLVTDRWKDHTRNLTHIASEKKYQQMLDDENEPDSKKERIQYLLQLHHLELPIFLHIKRKRSWTMPKNVMIQLFPK